MPTIKISHAFYALALVLVICVNSLRADYFIFDRPGFGGGPIRLDNHGQYIEYIDFIRDDEHFSESYDDWVMTPDLGKFYVLDNNLGFSDIFPFDIAADSPVDVDFDTTCCFDPTAPNAIIQGNHPDIIGNNLFVVSNRNFNGPTPNYASIKRFDTTTGTFLGTTPFLPNKEVLDMRVYSIFQQYVLSDGIYLREGPFGFSQITQIAPHVPGDRALLIGPDDLLYITNSQSREVRRYTLDGDFVDVFLTSGDLGTTTPWSAQFGPNGDFYVLGNIRNENVNAVIKRFDSSTSQFISEIVIDPSVSRFNTFGSRFYITAVPEPATVAIVSLLGGSLLLFRSRKCQLA